jgi:hypothetical protein
MIVDRFEGELAVLLFEDTSDCICWPRQRLPEETKEGDFLQLDICVDIASTKAALQKNIELLQELAKKE